MSLPKHLKEHAMLQAEMRKSILGNNATIVGSVAELTTALASAEASASLLNPYSIMLATSLYTVPATLEIPSYTTLDLNGSILQGDAATNASLIVNADITGDNDITIKNGIIDWNDTNRTGVNSVESIAVRMRRVSGLNIENITGLDGNKFIFLIILCNDYYFNNIKFNTNSDGIHFHNGAGKGSINNIFGFCGDDMIAYTHNEYAAYQEITDEYSDFDDVAITNIFPENTDNAVIKCIGGSTVRFSNTGITDNADGTFTVAAAGHDLVNDDVATLAGITPAILNGEHTVTAFTPGVDFTFAFAVSGKHNGGNNTSALIDLNQSWTIDDLIGMTVNNTADGSSATITDNEESRIDGALSGGAQNDWDYAEAYTVDVGNSSVHGTCGKQYYYNSISLTNIGGSTNDIAIKLGEDNTDPGGEDIAFCHIKSFSMTNVSVDYADALISIAGDNRVIVDNFVLDIRGSIELSASKYLFSSSTTTGVKQVNNLTLQNFDISSESTAARAINANGIDFKNVYTLNGKVDGVEEYFNQVAGYSYRAKLFFNNFSITNSLRGVMLRDNLLVYCSNVYHNNLTSHFVYGFTAGTEVDVYGDITKGADDSRSVNVTSTQRIFGSTITTVQASTTGVVGALHRHHTDGRTYNWSGSAWVAI